MIEYKLVRDKIPEIINKEGGVCGFYIAKNDEYQSRLYDKIQEEILEFKNNPSVEEFVDMLEVIDAIRKYFNLSLDEIKKMKDKKYKTKGGFNKKIIMKIN